MHNLLNTNLGIIERIRFEPAAENLIKAVLTHPNGSSLEIYNLGAHISSWISAEHGEVLFLSKTAEFRVGKAIRGGIPIIFPQFGPNGPLASHGFARSMPWTFRESRTNDSGDLFLTLRLESSEQTQATWPHLFLFDLEIGLSKTLSLKMRITNAGEADLSFTMALHSYFLISDISMISIQGLSPLEFLDNLKGLARTEDSRSTIEINSEVDRIYLSTSEKSAIVDSGLQREIALRKNQLPDSVLWNPWIEKGKAIKDLETDGYRKFVCVEAGAIERPIQLRPGGSFTAEHEISVSSASS